MADETMTPTQQDAVTLRHEALAMRGGYGFCLNADKVDAIAGRLEALGAAVERVRALHMRDHGLDPWSSEPYDICEGCGMDWPCDTTRALDAQEATNG